MQLSLLRLRKRLPLVAFVLFIALLLLCVGLAYACANSHPGQLDEKAASAAPPAALMEMWSLVAVALVGGSVYGGRRRLVANARSPAALKRLLL